jgi:hypothetical protein
VIGLLADANIQGQVELLVARMRGESWRDFWNHLNLRHVTFADVGLQPADSDTVIWHRCQQMDLVLLTDNRDDGPDSLEATIRANNQPTSLPVFTIGNVRQLSESPTYADRVIDQLFTYLLELENIRGTGRLYLP